MDTSLVISRHNPESCWMHNPATRQIHVNLANNLESLLKKHKVSLLGCWFDLPDHTLYEFYDAPNREVFQKLAAEPEILQWASFTTGSPRMVLRRIPLTFTICRAHRRDRSPHPDPQSPLSALPDTVQGSGSGSPALAHCQGIPYSSAASTASCGRPCT